MLGLNLFHSKERKEVIKAIELTKQRMEIDAELNQLRGSIKNNLAKVEGKKIKIDGQGVALIKVNYKNVLDTNKLTELLSNNKELLAKFVADMSIVKHGALEKYLGTPEYEKLIAGTETTESVVFIVE